MWDMEWPLNNSPQEFDVLFSVFNALILGRLLYAIPFWWGLASSSDKDRLEAVLRKAKKANLCDPTIDFNDRVARVEDRLLSRIVENPNHVLHEYLPPRRASCRSLRSSGTLRDFVLPQKTTLYSKLFPYRLLYAKSY